ncbi:MAG: phosphatidylserine decarboxylase family protein, partial [Gemmatimonadetes bacterium]|nr:phosphatidylserine decarboxylase family protein [Gemmatimonadota bacterium]
MIRLAPEGWPFVLPPLALTGFLALGTALVPDEPRLLQHLLLGATIAFGLLTGFIVFFFRNPPRVRRDGDGLVLAPADGRIVEIAQGEENDLFAQPATRISIFLSIFNVHVQRAPITGRIGLKSYQPGGFAAAWKPKASEENEQATLGIVAGDHRIMVRQIAGLVARRIVTDPEQGDLVPQGSRIGLIRFGSRVDLMVPAGWDLTCRKGDRGER